MWTLAVRGTIVGDVRALLAFSRPHTIIGTTLSVVALAILAAVHTAAAVAWPAVVAVLIGALATNVYIVGINQVTDLEIDRINKPWLPLASGALTLRAGRRIVWGCAVVALVVGVAAGPWASAAFAVGLTVGSAYSLPPLRLKRFALWAALSIAAVRGLAVNVLLFWHFLALVGVDPQVPPMLLLLTGVVLALSLAIAWFKDIPDMDGDRHFAVRTLTLRLGPRRVLRLGVVVLELTYLAVITAAVVGVTGLHSALLIVAHAAAAVVLVVAALRVDVERRAAIARFYLLVWVLFYAEYLVFPAAGLAA